MRESFHPELRSTMKRTPTRSRACRFFGASATTLYAHLSAKKDLNLAVTQPEGRGRAFNPDRISREAQTLENSMVDRALRGRLRGDARSVFTEHGTALTLRSVRASPRNHRVPHNQELTREFARPRQSLEGALKAPRRLPVTDAKQWPGFPTAVPCLLSAALPSAPRFVSPKARRERYRRQKTCLPLPFAEVRLPGSNQTGRAIPAAR